MTARLVPLGQESGLDLRTPPGNYAPSTGSTCRHDIGCSCRRPDLGKALVIAIALQLVMGIVAIATGALAVGLVVCGSMAVCMWVFVVTEIIAFYRVGLPETDEVPPGPVLGVRYESEQLW